MVGSKVKYAPKQIPGELVGDTSEAEIQIGNHNCRSLLDTGSTVSNVSETFYKQNLSECELHSLEDLLQVEAANGQPLPFLGYIEAELFVPSISPQSETFLFLVVPDTNFNQKVPVLLGTNALCPLMEKCKATHGIQFLQRAGIGTSWELAFRCIATQDKNLNKENGVLAQVKSIDTQLTCSNYFGDRWYFVEQSKLQTMFRNGSRYR